MWLERSLNSILLSLENEDCFRAYILVHKASYMTAVSVLIVVYRCRNHLYLVSSYVDLALTSPGRWGLAISKPDRLEPVAKETKLVIAL